ncbi:MAG TPA: glycosyltransferase [Candidatus Paceibacterota bacterium]|nr:glycosyltransferase [Candidatus Paceibacterota bacterium]
MQPAPIALFVYNRPEHTRKTLEALKANKHASETELFVFSDGPKSETNRAAVAEVRRLLQTIEGFKAVHVTERFENWGLAQSIIAGVTELVNQFGRVIVLEDDLVTGPHFLDYMNDGLTTYADDAIVASIHGYVYPIGTPLPETFFLRGADCWGWATWKRAWDLFEPDGTKLLRQLEMQKLIRSFDFDDTDHFSDMLKRQIEGKNDSWAIRWNASAYLAGALTLYPHASLVHNIGNDASGTHASRSNRFDSAVYTERVLVKRIPLAESSEARGIFTVYFRSLRPSLLKRIWNKLCR